MLRAEPALHGRSPVAPSAQVLRRAHPRAAWHRPGCAAWRVHRVRRPSGCGKSTLLRSIAGLEGIDSGEIRIGGKPVQHLPPRLRDIAMVFQDYALYPHKTLFENMAFGLRLRKTPEA
jgi:ABC-type polar amino acid transport system ATPase subunit